MKTRIILLAVLATAMLVFVHPAAACNPPTNVAVSNITPTSATITWDMGDSSATYTKIEWYSSTSFMAVRLAGSASQYNIHGLIPNTYYTIRIASVCGSGTRSDTSTWTQVDFQTDSINCYDPRNVHLLYKTDNAIALRWIEGEYVQRYLIKWWIEGQTRVDSTILIARSGSGTEQYDGTIRCCIQGLDANTAYHIQIKTSCLGGSSTIFDTLFSTSACNSIISLPIAKASRISLSSTT